LGRRIPDIPGIRSSFLFLPDDWLGCLALGLYPSVAPTDATASPTLGLDFRSTPIPAPACGIGSQGPGCEAVAVAPVARMSRSAWSGPGYRRQLDPSRANSQVPLPRHGRPAPASFNSQAFWNSAGSIEWGLMGRSCGWKRKLACAEQEEKALARPARACDKTAIVIAGAVTSIVHYIAR